MCEEKKYGTYGSNNTTVRAGNECREAGREAVSRVGGGMRGEGERL